MATKLKKKPNTVFEKSRSIEYKSAIKSVAKEYARITKYQLDPLFDIISGHLKSEYPAMTEEQATDWATEFINNDNHEYTFKRLDQLFDK